MRPSLWQRRYILRYFQRHGDQALTRGSGLSCRQVRAVLEAERAVRTASEERRLQRLGESVTGPPTMFTPRRALAAVSRFESRPLDRRDALLIASVFIASLLLYGLTAARTVTGEDAGELVAAAHGLGVAHPPGYPLWTLLGFSFDRVIPFGTVAFRVSLVSVVFSAAANAVLLALGLKLFRHRLAAVFSASLFAVSLTHWRQAVIPEVYGLNTFLLLSGVLQLLRLAEKPGAARLLVLATIGGLSLTNHTSAVPVVGVLGVGALLVAPTLFRRPLVVAGAFLALLLPLGLYAYLPLASAADPYLDWGNPETWDRFVAHVTRSQYAGAEAEVAEASTYGDYLRRLGILAGSMVEQFGGPQVLALAVIGLFAMGVLQPGMLAVMFAMGWLTTPSSESTSTPT